MTHTYSSVNAAKTLPRKTHVFVDLAQDTLLAKIRADHHDFAKPRRGREAGSHGMRNEVVGEVLVG